MSSEDPDKSPIPMDAKPKPSNRLQAWPVILENIANGSSLTAALKRLTPAPSYWWAKDALRRDPILRARYQEACEDRADHLAEELLELADKPIPHGLDGPGKSAWVQKLRLQVDTRKWIACKLKPRQYGDRVDVEVKHTSISIVAALAEAERRVLAGKVVETTKSNAVLKPCPSDDSRAYMGGTGEDCRIESENFSATMLGRKLLVDGG
jgi:hypothetical protein